MKIQEQLEDIATSSNFFEEEKRRQAEKRDQERAQNIRDALAFGEPVSTRDANWLKKYDEALAAGTTLVLLAAEKKAAFMKPKTAENAASAETATSEEAVEASSEVSDEMVEAIESFDNDEDLDEASNDQLFADSEEESSEEDELPFLGEADDIDEEGSTSV